MRLPAVAANAMWYASNLPAWRAFRSALGAPERAQAQVFRRLMRRLAGTSFGREHHLSGNATYEQFRNRVPLRIYDDFAPWITRIKDGEPNVLTTENVRRLATTSGTTSGRKLIPYTSSFQAEMNRAIGPWIVDLFHRQPSLFGGRAYWSISPVTANSEPETSTIPIGFEDDSEYLGGIRRHLVDALMTVPSNVRHAANMEDWRRQTVEHLTAAPDLRLISIWHPSFLELLFAEPDAAETLWPKLAVISCWADGQSALPAAALAERFPGVHVQPKGLLATEGVVSIPFQGRWPLAIRSHFLEFIEDGGRVLLAHELRDNAEYEVVLTTGGGLYRYSLGDRIRVEGFLGRTPSIRFVGRSGQVSDRFGEKLAEPFVASVLRDLQTAHRLQWRFAMLAPDGPQYCLFFEGEAAATLAAELDQALRENPHYAYCRDLGQLRSCTVCRVERGDVSYIRRLTELGQRTGDIKPAALSKLDGWRNWFERVRSE